MGIGRELTGTPWHVERYTRQEGDKRRHRSRCIYYDTVPKYCRHQYGKCVGASHCLYYAERRVKDELDTASVSAKNKTQTIVEGKETKKLREIGKAVIHKKYGKGTIIHADSIYSTVRFENGTIQKFKTDFCVKNGIFKI